ncbi:hypothetical protein [Vibrio gallaecicus]|uniref:hypothetical protein n=1 Tax=Vibrio gallaecicus TaxID=552386 RepID=UPI0025B4EFEF|nr:hypothetical protein [Vibrio gallaecicus]MDN3616001.1 hypothetical protein [Vibrio gallaecicus]
MYKRLARFDSLSFRHIDAEEPLKSLIYSSFLTNLVNQCTILEQAHNQDNHNQLIYLN